MSDQPLVSVVIPCYNHEKFVQDCIQSVIDQTYANIELIIIDDGSSDHSVEKIQDMVDSCKERFVNFEFRHRENIGLSATLNEALSWCKGLYLSPIASDDQMLRDKVKLQVDFCTKEPDYVAVFGGINQVDENNKILRKLQKKNRSYNFDDIAKLDYFLQAPTQFFRLNDIISIGGYNNKYRIEDWYSYLLLTKNGSKIFLMNDILCNYRRHECNSSKNMDLMMEKLEIINDLGLTENQKNKYLPYIYLSIANDLAISQKNKAIENLLKAVSKNWKLIVSIRFFKVLIKISLPYRMLEIHK